MVCKLPIISKLTLLFLVGELLKSTRHRNTPPSFSYFFFHSQKKENEILYINCVHMEIGKYVKVLFSFSAIVKPGILLRLQSFFYYYFHRTKIK